MSIFTPENGFVPQSGLDYDPGSLNRLNARFRAFLEPQAAAIRGKRVLDLASHDGRWSLAALRLGADHVTGIEVRPELIEKSRYILSEADRARVRFIPGDIFEAMPKLLDLGETFDVVLCLGIFYHILDHDRLLRQMIGLRPDLIVLDTGLALNDEPLIHLRSEGTGSILNAAPGQHVGASATIGIVSTGALELMARNYGYGVEYVDWEQMPLEDRTRLQDYFNEQKGTRIKRMSCYLTPRAPASRPRPAEARAPADAGSA